MYSGTALKKMVDRSSFIAALEDPFSSALISLPKSDLHSHAGRACRLSFINSLYGTDIAPPRLPFISLSEMDGWVHDLDETLRKKSSLNRYLACISGAFVAAKEDNITILALNFGMGEMTAFGGVNVLKDIVSGLKERIYNECRLFPVVSIYDNLHLGRLYELIESGWVSGIDFINYGDRLSLKEMKHISRYVKGHGMKVKAHVGEFDSADAVARYIDELEPDEIQHGIQAAFSDVLLKRIAECKIRMNICPCSNISLGLFRNYESFPIKKLLDCNVKVALGTDDLLVFGATISDEFRNLYLKKSLSAEELYSIYLNGMDYCLRH